MKHIKKSFFLQLESEEFDSGIKNQSGLVSVPIGNKDILKKNKGAIIFTQTTKNLTIGGLVQKIGSEHYIFPVPDPTLVYFHNAQMNLIQTNEVRRKLLNSLSTEEIKKDIPIHDLYNYYGYATSVIINLFTALESFLNQQIPSNYEYVRKNGNKSTEIFNNQQILEYIDFKTKLTVIIPDIMKKNFMGNQSSANQFIWSLKEFRDDIVHTKPKVEHPLYEDLMKKSLNFKFDKAIGAVAKLMNFYQPEYIVECDCGKDY